MGVDLRVITGHRLSAAAVLDFGTTINNDPILKELEFDSGPPKALKDWHETATVEQLTEQWRNDLASANDKTDDSYYDNYDYEFEKVGDIVSFYPKIVFTSGWHSRFRIMETAKNRQEICAYYNRFGQLFEQKHVLFFASYTLPSSFIFEEIYTNTIDEILEMVRKQFGFKQLSDMTDQWFKEFGFYIHTVKH